MKQVLRKVAFTAAIVAALSRIECDGATQPNILFIMADDHAEVQTNLMEQVLQLRKELKEPPKDDPKSYGAPEQIPPNL